MSEGTRALWIEPLFEEGFVFEAFAVLLLFYVHPLPPLSVICGERVFPPLALTSHLILFLSPGAHLIRRWWAGMRARASQKAKWERTERATLSTIHGHLSGQVHAQSGTVQGSKEDEEEERTGGMEEGRKENKREKRGQKEGSGDNAKPKRENKSKNKNAKAVESESKLEKSATRKEKKRKRKGEGATVKTMATITETTIVQGTAAENKCFAGVNEMEVFLQDFTQEKREKRQRKKAAESHEGCLAKRPNKRKRRPSEDISKDTRQPGS